jgi:predicted lipoprotein with Yx(FWY)xxD motif
MKPMMLGLTAAILFTGAAIGGAFAAEPATTVDANGGKVWVGEKSMTLYTFDMDKAGETASACTGKCIAAWPPLAAPADAKASADGEWTTVTVTDKDGKAGLMWAYKGSPLYYFVKDTKAGDMTGEGVGGVWHIAMDK